jgi:hypothetical protein
MRQYNCYLKKNNWSRGEEEKGGGKILHEKKAHRD